jgi:hypothetical protein
MTTSSLPPVPAKVQRLLAIAAKYNELISFECDDELETTRTWEIRTDPNGPRAVDTDRIWVYWNPAANGGRVTVDKYYTGSRKSYKITQAQAGTAIAMLAGH